MNELVKLLNTGEGWLVDRVLHYAHERGYTRHTPPLSEPWRMAVAGMTFVIATAADRFGDSCEINADENLATDPVADFLRIEARRHRERGISLTMFVGMLKYFREAYRDRIRSSGVPAAQEARWLRFVDRCYDRVEIAIAEDWAGEETASEKIMARSRDLIDEKNRYLSLAESISTPLFLLDENGDVTFMNRAGRDMAASFGIAAAERSIETMLPWMGGAWREFHSAETGARRVELPVSTPYGTRHYEIAFSRLKDVTGAKSGTIVGVADITDRRLADQIDLNRQKLEALGQMAAGIAHELNTPLQFVESNLSFLRETGQTVNALVEKLVTLGKEEGIAEERLTGILAEADFSFLREEFETSIDETADGVQRAAHIVRGIKQFSRPAGFDRTEVDLNALIERCVSLTRNEWKYCAEVETNLAPALPELLLVENDIAQALINILVNASHAVADIATEDNKGRITVTTSDDRGRARIEIQDTGPGIPETIKHQVFNPFFTTKPIGKGTGQGLAITHAIIVGKHNGSISFDSSPETGTTFIIHLPYA